jgi:hypothetical protein
VDLVGKGVSAVERHPGDRPCETRSNVIEGVVIVVQHDHHPLTTQT